MARAALVPLLTALGTTAAVAVLAQKYIPQYMERKHKHTKKTDKTQELPPQTMQNSASPPSPVLQKKNNVPAPVEPVAARSSLLVALLLQDSYLLVSAFGVCVMVIAVLVSLALVSLREDVESLNDLQMFPPLMLVAMAMISLGMVGSMLSPKTEAVEEPVNAASVNTTMKETAAAMPMDASQKEGFLYAYYRNKYADQTEETGEIDEDGQPIKRASRCPFGFT